MSGSAGGPGGSGLGLFESLLNHTTRQARLSKMRTQAMRNRGSAKLESTDFFLPSNTHWHHVLVVIPTERRRLCMYLTLTKRNYDVHSVRVVGRSLNIVNNNNIILRLFNFHALRRILTADLNRLSLDSR